MGSVELDSELVKRVQQGDKSAFDVLVQKYQQKVVNLISRFVSDQSECYDVAQETFIKAYRALDKFRGDSQFYTWLYRIAANTAKNHLASRARKSPKYSVDVEDAEHFSGDSQLKDNTTPESLMLTEEIKQTVYAAIDNLPEDLKSAITLRELEGLSYEEIADVMDCPIGTVRSRIFRARDAIDKELRPLLE
ncbi:MAG: RNA polymerase sigma factor RpoE [Gammaproteobacteria bacterium]|jgi:RNA polymerase sigma-70 factor (ECF subfamily)|nr:RNA polymerase sigma factor RpoE [Gammaproteobacteria bacterium]MBT3724037.1 RNA polymerase sigma factor RpoE [Gammaproteobacteria bacterium]MBT4076637.1 RNA polymerase sigma factor RpoE [Gammaproteobacteria bacterium]MBT4194371.1 RNA polymerase sigma factor RpoE [Gammaproteobacteria bacterium]MBT4451202.1 RNA polymerase sigma factor RpoE [Gammaproteobacteria bacterium]